MNHNPDHKPIVPFRPTLKGCVSQDARMARAVNDCYCAKLISLAAYTYAALMTSQGDRALSDMLDAFAVEEAEHFRLLGELILALGGNPAVRTQVRVSQMERKNDLCMPCERSIRQMIEESVQAEKAMSERLQTLMGKTEDRVVRSLFAYLDSDGQRHIEHLMAVIV